MSVETGYCMGRLNRRVRYFADIFWELGGSTEVQRRIFERAN